jgi:hypothetical protein
LNDPPGICAARAARAFASPFPQIVRLAGIPTTADNLGAVLSMEGEYPVSETRQNKPVRQVLTIVMDLLVIVAVADTVRMVVRFFGAFADKSWGELIVALTSPITIGFGFEAIKTPYSGVFDVNAALTVLAVLVVEWVLSIVRSRA